MTNHGIARVFRLIGDLMEIRGDNPYKIRAYRNAAETMEGLTESLEAIASRGALKAIPGVGDAIAGKTREIITRGTCDLLEQLRSEIPDGLAPLLGLPGLGPKKVTQLWKQLQITSLDELESAAQSGRLASAPGFGGRRVEVLREDIQSFRLRQGRHPIGRARPVAEELAAILRSRREVRGVTIAGSLRRCQDIASEVTLVVTSSEPEGVGSLLRDCLAGAGWREAGPQRWSGVTEGGLAVDVRAARPAAAGGELLTATGPDTLVSAIRERAAWSGRRLLPSGLPETTEGTDAEQAEAAAFAALGLPWIPPELRDWEDVLALADAGRLPRLVTEQDIRGILHAHSDWSDGAAPISAMVEAASSAGYAYHAVTDHSKALTVARGLDEERLRSQRAEIDALNRAVGQTVRVLAGIECDILSAGELDLDLDSLRQLDLVVASVHTQLRQEAEQMTSRVERALRSGVVSILGHPTGRLLGAREPAELDIERVLAAALETDVALEINAAPERLDLNDVHARRAKEFGLKLAINTDAHRPAHVAAVRFGIGQARRAGLGPEDVINCWEPERLTDWLQSRGKQRSPSGT